MSFGTGQDVARAADISRPGLYFLFASKQNLFRHAVTQAFDEDVDAAKRSLADTRRPLRDRLIEAFDLWTGRYIGPMAKEVAILMETNPELLGPIVTDYPKRFSRWSRMPSPPTCLLRAEVWQRTWPGRCGAPPAASSTKWPREKSLTRG
jgi:AcrR family transcriptional regulator